MRFSKAARSGCATGCRTADAREGRLEQGLRPYVPLLEFGACGYFLIGGLIRNEVGRAVEDAQRRIAELPFERVRFDQQLGVTKPSLSGHFRVLLSLVSRKRGGNRGALAVEFGRSLERVTDPQYPGLVESLAGDLKGERQTVLETDRH